METKTFNETTKFKFPAVNRQLLIRMVPPHITWAAIVINTIVISIVKWYYTKYTIYYNYLAVYDFRPPCGLSDQSTIVRLVRFFFQEHSWYNPRPRSLLDSLSSALDFGAFGVSELCNYVADRSPCCSLAINSRSVDCFSLRVILIGQTGEYRDAGAVVGRSAFGFRN